MTINNIVRNKKYKNNHSNTFKISAFNSIYKMLQTCNQRYSMCWTVRDWLGMGRFFFFRYRVMVCNRPTTWPSATVKKPSGRSACWGRRQRETPSSGSLRWCSPETSEPPLPGFTSGSYLWECSPPCTPPRLCRQGLEQKTVRETMGVWFGRTLGAGFGAKSVDSKSRDQNRMQGSLLTDVWWLSLNHSPKMYIINIYDDYINTYIMKSTDDLEKEMIWLKWLDGT